MTIPMTSNSAAVDSSSATAKATSWHTIRPWSPRFLLSVREITSVSTTLVLAAAPSSLSGVGNGHSARNDGDDDDGDEDDAPAPAHARGPPGLVSDVLSRGLSVNVNGAPWKRVLMRLDDRGRARRRRAGSDVEADDDREVDEADVSVDDNDEEEAVIVLYGLMPGRQYDIELGVVWGESGEEVLHMHSRMVTQPTPGAAQGQSTGEDAADSSFESNASSITSITSSSNAITTSAAALSSTSTSNPNASSSNLNLNASQASPRTMPNSMSLTLDEYAAQLRAQLAALNAEREALAGQLKAARREANKGDAARRGEIEALKRASEKHTTADMRGKQKARALAEATKQAAATARSCEDEARDVERDVPALRKREREVVKEHARVASEAERAKREAEECVGRDRKRIAEERAELASVTTRVEKVQAKKDRLAGETLPELEAQLARLIREVELVDRDAGAFEVIDNGPVAFDLGTSARTGLVPTLTGSSTSSPQGMTSASTPTATPGALLSSPPASAGRQQQQQPAQMPRGMYAMPSPGITTPSAHAPPFDPSSAHNVRLGAPLQLQPPGAKRRPSVPPTSGGKALGPPGPSPGLSNSNINGHTKGSPNTTLAHTHTQSWDVSPGSHPQQQLSPGIGGGAGANGSTNAGAGIGINSMALGGPPPSRQTSLPVRMPSYVNATAQGVSPNR